MLKFVPVLRNGWHHISPAPATLVCDCGRRHCHTRALAGLVFPCFSANPQDRTGDGFDFDNNEIIPDVLVHEDPLPSVEYYVAVHNPQDHHCCIDELRRFDERPAAAVCRLLFALSLIHI